MDTAYVPAASFEALTPLYDPLVKLVFRERRFRERVADAMDLRPGLRVLDVGCGTGTLAVHLARRGVEVTALDGDPKILRIARRKIARAGVAVELVEALAEALPFADGRFDRVVSTLALHHIAEKPLALREMARVLRPDGELHVADLGPAVSFGGRVVTAFTRRHARASDLVGGRLPLLLLEAGFADVAEIRRTASLFGPIVHWRARRLEALSAED